MIASIVNENGGAKWAAKCEQILDYSPGKEYIPNVNKGFCPFTPGSPGVAPLREPFCCLEKRIKYTVSLR
jgi:hypothetical protein